MTLLAEDLLWLLLDDVSGHPLPDKISLSRVLAGAVLIDLTRSQTTTALARVTGPGEAVRPGRLELLDDRAGADPVLARAAVLLRRRAEDRR
jgi:hypothetical protein